MTVHRLIIQWRRHRDYQVCEPKHLMRGRNIDGQNLMFRALNYPVQASTDAQ